MNPKHHSERSLMLQIFSTVPAMSSIPLFHLELPPRLLEWGGAEDVATEEKIESERADEYRRMEEKRQVKGQALCTLQKTLARKGTTVAERFIRFEEPLDATTVSRAILDAAREHECGTIVVGRHAFSGLKHWFQYHVSENLVRQGSEVGVWVVE